MNPEFNKTELEIQGHHDHIKPQGKGVPKLNSPISAKENLLRALNGERPYWYPNVGMAGGDDKPFRPRMFPDLLVAHDVMDGEPPMDFSTLPPVMDAWFDTHWRYVDVAGGAMIEPGTHLIDDMNDWEKITWPNLDELDWEASAKANKDYLESELPIEFCIPTGYWERLMSLMDVSDAAVMMIDEDQEEACNAFLTKLTDFYIDFIKRVKKYYNPDIILMHDDWGHQNGPFFSVETHRERILPHFKRFVSAVHDEGMRFELHCCGLSESFVPAMIEAGVDLWCPQPMNDVKALAETYRDSGITFGIMLDVIAPGMPNEEEIATKVAQEFADIYGDGPVAYVNYGGSDILYQKMYEQSRKLYHSNSQASSVE